MVKEIEIMDDKVALIENEAKHNENDFLAELEEFNGGGDGDHYSYYHYVSDLHHWRKLLLDYFAQKTYPNIFSVHNQSIIDYEGLCMCYNDNHYHQFFIDLINYECPVSFDYVDNQERTSVIYKLIVESEHLRKFFERLWRDCENKDQFINGLVEYLKAKDKLVIEYEVVKEERELYLFTPNDREKDLLAKIKHFDDTYLDERDVLN